MRSGLRDREVFPGTVQLKIRVMETGSEGFFFFRVEKERKLSRRRSVWNPIFGLLGFKQEDHSSCAPGGENLKVNVLAFTQLNRAKLRMTNKKQKSCAVLFLYLYTECSLAGVNRVSTSSVQEKKTKKEKCTTWEDTMEGREIGVKMVRSRLIPTQRLSIIINKARLCLLSLLPN